MRWIAPTEKDDANHQLEKRLWDAADQFRANSGLKAGQYSTPVLGLIFLRFAEARFAQRRAQLEKAGASPRRGTSRIDDPKAYQAEGVLFLTPSARFDYLLQRPEGSNVGRAVNEAMADVEKHNPQLAGVLPRNYQIFNGTLLKELLKKVSEIPVSLDFDAFGRIYEYFLGEFARTEGQKGGEFYTPAPIVRLMVEILEPFHGRILDPACGSGGMFVQSARFVAEHRKNPMSELSVFGVEKTDETGRLARMNLAVHGLEGDIRHGGEVNSYYDDPHDATGHFDFVLANPPFNVNAVDFERLKNSVGPGRRFPFGLPRSDNANYLWIQLFYSALNAKGRAGFVMHNSAADSEPHIRKKLIDANAVDVIVATSANLFYTVSLPCALWFLDRARPGTPRKNHILFIDARDYYRQVDTVHREITDSQVSELVSIVKSYRGESGSAPYKDRPGVCKKVAISEITARNYCLNPKIYIDSKKAKDGHLQRSLGLAEDIAIWNEEANQIRRSLSSNLNVEIPLDRGVLTQLAKLLFKKWFVNLEPRGQKVAVSRKALPGGWRLAPFRGLVADYGGGGWGTESADEKHSQMVRVVRGTDMFGVTVGELANCPTRYIKKSQLDSRILSEGDIVIEVSGGGKEQPTGRTTYVTGALISRISEPVICASFCKLVRMKAEILRPTIAYLHLQYIYDQRLIEKYEVQSTGIKNFKFEYFLDHELVLVPPDPVQNEFHSIISKIFQLIHVIGAISEAAAELVHVLPSTPGPLVGLADLQIQHRKSQTT